ncbi:glycogen synthase GlgA [Alkalibacterium iburiense]
MNLLFAASECAPFFKTGGLGDVMGALPKELAKNGNDVRVVLPFFVQKLDEETKNSLKDVVEFTVEVGWRKQHCGIKQLKRDKVTYYFIDNLFYFDRPNLYDYGDDGERFAFFQQAVIEMLEKIDFIPDVLHVNDWQTAMIPVLLKDKYSWIKKYRDIRTVLTIHNILFQGVYDPYTIGDWFNMGYGTVHEEGLKYGDKVCWLKGALYFSDLITTVSPTYAQEVQTPEFGYGLETHLQNNSYKLTGILNGIDYDTYNPETDTTIPHTFSKNDLSGKTKNKKILQEKVGLPVDEHIALMGIVTRLDEQKGVQLIIDSMEELLKHRHVQLVLLGTGKPYFEEAFRYFSEAYPEKFQAVIHFDSELAQLIYAGVDLFLMPSLFEPCGLSQLNSLRYGTLPIVHEVGGLADTIEPHNKWTGEGTGFSFYDFNVETMLQTIDSALTLYYEDPDGFNEVQKNAMSKDNSWKKSALEYIDQYKYIVY